MEIGDSHRFASTMFQQILKMHFERNREGHQFLTELRKFDEIIKAPKFLYIQKQQKVNFNWRLTAILRRHDNKSNIFSLK